VHAKTNTHFHHDNIPRHKERGTNGRVVRPEPQDLVLINEDSNVRAYFEQVGCMHYCEKIQGYNVKLAEQFALKFNGFCVIIAGITFWVTEETLSVAMEIPHVVKGGLRECL
jgi:hypothetical protein